MRKCKECGTEMESDNVKGHIRDPDSYGCYTKFVVVGRWYECPKCGAKEYEEIRDQYGQKILRWERCGEISPGIDRGPVLLFYVTSPVRGIKGYAIIKNVSSGEPSDVWKNITVNLLSKRMNTRHIQKANQVLPHTHLRKLRKYLNVLIWKKIREVLSGFNHQAGQKITVSGWERIREII